MALLETRIVGGWVDLAPNDIDQAVVKGAFTLTILATRFSARSRCRVMIEAVLAIVVVLHTSTSLLARQSLLARYANSRLFFRCLFLRFREALVAFVLALVRQVEHGAAGSRRRTLLFRTLVDCAPGGQISLSFLGKLVYL